MKVPFNKIKIHTLLILFIGITHLNCTTISGVNSNTEKQGFSAPENSSVESNQAVIMQDSQKINSNALMITDVDILQFYESQAQIVFELYVEAQNQFRNMRYYNALNLLDRSISVVPTIQAYLLQVMIYSRIGNNEKARQVYAQAEILNDAMGEDLLKPMELLTGVTVVNSSN